MKKLIFALFLGSWESYEKRIKNFKEGFIGKVDDFGKFSEKNIKHKKPTFCLGFFME